MSHGSHGSSMSGMDGMDMGSSTSSSCEMHMLGNWETIGACFLTSSWRISTQAQFAGTCIGVGLLVMLIESIRRWGREYDRWLMSNALSAHQRRTSHPPLNKTNHHRFVAGVGSPLEEKGSSSSSSDGSHASNSAVELESGLAQPDPQAQVQGADEMGISPHILRSRPRPHPAPRGAATLHRLESTFFGLPKDSSGHRALQRHHGGDVQMFRLTAVQQGVRSTVYALQFTGAYIIMLIAMSFNGYILLSIILGALIGHFFSTWDTISFPLPSSDLDDEEGHRGPASSQAQAQVATNQQHQLAREHHNVVNSAAASQDPYLLMTGGGGASSMTTTTVTPSNPRAQQTTSVGTKAYGGISGTCCD